MGLPCPRSDTSIYVLLSTWLQKALLSPGACFCNIAQVCKNAHFLRRMWTLVLICGGREALYHLFSEECWGRFNQIFLFALQLNLNHVHDKINSDFFYRCIGRFAGIVAFIHASFHFEIVTYDITNLKLFSIPCVSFITYWLIKTI